MSPSRSSCETGSPRVLLSAFGATALARLADAALARLRPPEDLEEYAWIGCMLDLADEPPLSELESWAGLARSRSVWPPLAFVADSRRNGEDRRTFRRLADHLHVHVVESAAGARGLVDCAMSLVSALSTPGLVGVHVEDMRTLCGAARTGHASVLGDRAGWSTLLRRPDIGDVLLVIHASEDVTLQSINEAVQEVSSLLPGESEIMLAVPRAAGARGPALELSFIAFHRDVG